jgi:AraC-like DNA-binding protein
MDVSTLDRKEIELLRELPGLTPVVSDYHGDWQIKVFNRKDRICRNYLSPNRRDYYKIIFINEGAGVYTIGMHTYYIDEPTILFINPNDIISWKNLSPLATGHFTIFKKHFVEEHPVLKSVIEKYGNFWDPTKHVVRLDAEAVGIIDELFLKMHREVAEESKLAREKLQAHIQLLMLEAAGSLDLPKPELIDERYRHIHEFFSLLEKETSGINYSSPIRIRTAKAFADQLSLHPNHLNALLKKHTGQTLSTHIRNRLLEESKVLLMQTDWTLEVIGYSLGFGDQPSFSQFFKKNFGATPDRFRRQANH